MPSHGPELTVGKKHCSLQPSIAQRTAQYHKAQNSVITHISIPFSPCKLKAQNTDEPTPKGTWCRHQPLSLARARRPQRRACDDPQPALGEPGPTLEGSQPTSEYETAQVSEKRSGDLEMQQPASRRSTESSSPPAHWGPPTPPRRESWVPSRDWESTRSGRKLRHRGWGSPLPAPQDSTSELLQVWVM